MARVESAASAARAADDAAAARLVRRTLSQWWLIAACAVIAGIVGYVAASSRPSIYQATTTIQLNEVDLAAVFLGQNLQQQGQDAQAKATTSAALVTFPRVREAASRALGGVPSPERLADEVSVEATAGTTLIAISARDREPVAAARIADAMREAFIEIRRQSAVGYLNDARANLREQLSSIPESRRDGVAAQTLRDRLEQIETLRAVSNGGVETVQTARVPEVAVAPNPRRDAVLAFVVGAILGIGVALLRSRLDDRVRDVSELTAAWSMPVLGLIPQARELKADGSHRAVGPALEAFALARTNLRYLHVGGEVKTVVVTSALAEEGKSTVAWNLAVAAAMADQKVLIIDADLRRPVVAARAGIASGRGLSEVLAGLASPDEVIVNVAVPSPAGDITLDVVPAGLTPPSPVALLERAGTADLFRQMSAGYDLVLIDTPPATVVADAKMILGNSHGVIVVSRLGRVTTSALGRLRDLLSGLETPVLGVIVNSGAAAKSYAYGTYESQKPSDNSNTKRGVAA